MARAKQFRWTLPFLQTAVALGFGSWGLRLRYSALSQPFFGSTLWDSTARFHVWPWPLKFAVILNMPAFLIGSALSLMFDFFRIETEWVSYLPSLVLVPAVWCLIGCWLDRWQTQRIEVDGRAHGRWLVPAVVTIVALLGALTSGRYFGSYVTFVPFGVGLWMTLGIAMFVSGHRRRRMLRRKLRKTRHQNSV